MAVEISEVTLRASNDLIIAASLDSPQTGPLDGYAFEVYGWVESEAPVAEVEFVHEGFVVACCEPTNSSQAWFWKAIATVGLAPAFTVDVRVVFQDGRRDVIAEIRGTQQLTSGYTPSMQPIMVTSPGRSGSTLLMRMLAEHPDIVVHERFPYETFAFSYWMHFIHVLATPMDTSSVDFEAAYDFWTDRKRLFPFPYFVIGPPGWATPPEQATDRWYASEQVEEFAGMAQAAAESFYREYASARKCTAPAFFAEKIVPAGHIRTIMRQLYPGAREIFLVREPRDILASVLAYNSRHGFDGGFGAESVGTDEQLVRLVRGSLLSLTHLWKRRSQYDALVRYEDLVHSPTEQIRAMLDRLELDSASNIIDSMVKAGSEGTPDMNSHRTSPGGSLSIGRWQRDLDPRLQEICDEAFDGLLDELGGS